MKGGKKELKERRKEIGRKEGRPTPTAHRQDFPPTSQQASKYSSSQG